MFRISLWPVPGMKTRSLTIVYPIAVASVVRWSMEGVRKDTAKTRHLRIWNLGTCPKPNPLFLARTAFQRLSSFNNYTGTAIPHGGSSHFCFGDSSSPVASEQLIRFTLWLVFLVSTTSVECSVTWCFRQFSIRRRGVRKDLAK